MHGTPPEKKLWRQMTKAVRAILRRFGAARNPALPELDAALRLGLLYRPVSKAEGLKEI
jgi:hypothetical protein